MTLALAPVGDSHAGVEIVTAVDDQIVSTQQPTGRPGADRVKRHRDRQPRAGILQHFGGNERLGPADIGRAEQHLPRQVGQRNRIGVDQPQRADPALGQRLRRRAADAAQPDQRDPRLRQPPLPTRADLRQHQMPGKALEVGVAEAAQRLVFIQGEVGPVLRHRSTRSRLPRAQSRRGRRLRRSRPAPPGR